MRASTVTALCAGLSTLLSVGAARGQEPVVDNFSGVGVRAMGMGGAFVGVADDFSAVYWNPAGLAQMSEREVYYSFQRNSHEGKSALGDQRTVSELANTHLGSLGLVVPYPVYQGSLVFALGVNRVKDFDSVIRVRGFSDRQQLHLDNLFRHEGGLSTTTLAGAVDVSPGISLGLALNLWRGDDERVNDFDQHDSEDLLVGTRFATRDLYEDEYGGFNVTAGIMVRTPREKPRVRFGLTVSNGATHEIDYVFTGVPPPANSIVEYEPERVRVEGLDLPGDLPEDSRDNLVPADEVVLTQDVDADGHSFVVTSTGRRITYASTDEPGLVREQLEDKEIRGSYKVSLPIEFGAGIAFEPVPDLLLAGSAHLAEWAQSEYDYSDSDFLRADIRFEEEYANIIRYHLGIEWQVPEYTLTLRAGFYSDPLPYIGPPDAEDDDPSNTHLVLIEQDRRFVTLGAGLVVDQVIQLDLAWTRGNFGQKREGVLEEGTVTRSFASLAYHF